MIYKAKNLKERRLSELTDKISLLDKKPVLAVIVVGDNQASKVYVRNKTIAAERVGIKTFTCELPENTKQEKLEQVIQEYSSMSTVNGILLQLPLPEHLDSFSAIEKIDQRKDVDGLTTKNQGLLYNSKNCIIPCTPKGILSIIDDIGIDVNMKSVCVLGRSSLVGSPIARLLQDRGATVTVCHSKTIERKYYTKNADILISAIGKPGSVTPEDISRNTSVVIDVGINRVDDKVVGDCLTEEIDKKFSSCIITAAPGGVGLMTVVSLMENVYEASIMQV